MGFTELELVDWIARRAGKHHAVAHGIGDDMSVLRRFEGEALVSCDMLLEGVHFDSRRHLPQQIGRKAIACSLSDCAAMAARPLAATVAVALPRTMTEPQVHSFFEGALSVAGEFDLAIAGGDTSRWDFGLVVDVAVVAAPYPNSNPILRSGARPGDRLYVTGKLGGSLLGRHLAFQPRVREARMLVEALGERLHAMIDISDGLSLDLWRMCTASKAGATLEEAALTAIASDDAHRLAEQDGRSPLEHVLADGEDFELLLAVSGDAQNVSVPLFPVGHMTLRDLSLSRVDGTVEPLAPRGYVH